MQPTSNVEPLLSGWTFCTCVLRYEVQVPILGSSNLITCGRTYPERILYRFFYLPSILYPSYIAHIFDPTLRQHLLQPCKQTINSASIITRHLTILF